MHIIHCTDKCTCIYPLQVMNLRTGQPLTHIELPEENTAYVDVNEDGSVEQIRVAIDQQVMYI